ncbi:MAG TPA: anti-sigma factor domain-containing protein, partial [Ureibacillus sp.]|nr:anti-sigma factor domain-containing protein [Ureibacillus sp.]
MHTYNGIVCEIKKNYMIFMTTEGEFLRGIPTNKNAQIGDEVEFTLLSSPSLSYKRKKTLIIGPSLIAAALLIFFLTMLLPNTNSAFAYVQVGNELEFGIDETGKVISVESLIKEKSIEMNDLRGLPINEALKKAVEEISTDTQDLSITTRFNDEKPSTTKNEIEKAVNEVRNHHSNKTNNSTQKNNHQDNNSNGHINKENKANNGSPKNNSSKGYNGNSNNSFKAQEKQENSSNNEKNNQSQNRNSLKKEYQKSNSKKENQHTNSKDTNQNNKDG